MHLGSIKQYAVTVHVIVQDHARHGNQPFLHMLCMKHGEIQEMRGMLIGSSRAGSIAPLLKWKGERDMRTAKQHEVMKSAISECWGEQAAAKLVKGGKLITQFIPIENISKSEEVYVEYTYALLTSAQWAFKHIRPRLGRGDVCILEKRRLEHLKQNVQRSHSMDATEIELALLAYEAAERVVDAEDARINKRQVYGAIR